MKSKIKVGLLAVLALASFVPAASAQRMFPNSDPVSLALTADDSDVALLVKYTGTAPFSSVQTSSGDLLFKTGTASADTAATDITGCGGTAGTLDVDQTTCDTLGELVDRINASTYWRAVIVDGLRSDATASATLVTMAATNASRADGLAVKWDTSVNFEASVCLNCSRDISDYFGGAGNRVSPGLVPNPFAGRQAVFVIGNFTSTYASGTSTLKIFSVKPTNRVGAVGSETVTTLYAVAGGATTAAKELNYHPYGLLSKKDEKLLVRIDNSAAASSVLIYAYGESFRYPTTPR